MFLIARNRTYSEDLFKTRYNDDLENKTILTMAGKARVGAIVGDAFLSITALVIGILALTGVIRGVPPAASYTLLGLSGIITLSWIGLAAKTKGKVFPHAKFLLKTAISC